MRPRSVTDEDIIDAARNCLLAVGPSVTVAAIGERIGITGPAVLKRFGSKENLVARALLSEPPPDLSHGPDPGPLRAQLVETLLHIERLLLGAAPKLATLRAGGVKASQWLDKPHPRKARESLRGWLVKARKTHGLSHPDLDAAADLLISLVEARGFLSWVEPTWVETGDDWASRAVDALFGDLRPAMRKRRARAGARRKRTAKP
ncbi:MAG TPA: helix-turn-helix domain-containing protein [Vicinamibacterales bacterium]|jgi:AcrR family transcriptional regulator